MHYPLHTAIPSYPPNYLSLQTVIQLATLISVVVGFSGLIITIKNYHKQMTVQILMQYTARYERILTDFPPSVFITRFSASELPVQDSKLTVCLLRYLNLCAEEYFLTKHNYLAKNLWKVWEADLKRTIASPLLQREWPLLRKEFESHIEFRDYVDGVLKESAAEKPTLV
jgi:hypothetical protein